MSKPKPTLEDLIGIEYVKLGFFREARETIDELRVSNQELAQKKLQIQAILNGITDVIVVLSQDLIIQSVNHVYHEMYADPRPEGKFCHEVFHQQGQPCAVCPAVTAAKTNQVCRQNHICFTNGRNRHYEVTASPLRNAWGEPSYLLLLIRDVTLEKEYQAKYCQAEKMATMGVLASGVAHEINNPLTAISGFAEGLKRRLGRLGKPGEEAIIEDFKEYIGIILKECKRCGEIVKSLLAFGHQTARDFVPVNLNAVVTDTVKLLQFHLKRFPKKTVRLDLHELLPSIYGDESQLKQVILNLMFNALDAVQGQGIITIRTFVENEDWIALVVEDTGCGIPIGNRDKLFEPFFTTKPAGKGIGIGLSTCYNIVTRHGGEIAVTSKEGQGSTFLVRFPSRMKDADE